MSNKKSKKNVVDTSANNNYKKSKDTAATELVFCENVKMKNNDKAIVPLNKKKISLGNKRKLLDSDMKKTRKKTKILTNSNITETVDLPSESSNNLNFHINSKKGNKKNKMIKHENFMDKNRLNNLLEPLVQKIDKKKISNKLNEVKISVKQNDVLTSMTEVTSKNFDDINGQLNINDSENDNDNNEQCITIDTIQDNEDNQSDLNEIDFSQLIKKEEISERPKCKKLINWPEEDLKILIDRMEACIPDSDTIAFGTRVEKLEWDTIAFKEYSAEECKKIWFLLQKQVRRFRILKEVLIDVKEWIHTPKKTKNKAGRHPDMPRRPHSAYLIFYLQKQDMLRKAHPGLDLTEITKMLGSEFKSLPPEERLKYKNLAAKEKREYEKKLEEFYQSHPNMPRMEKGKQINPSKKSKSPELTKSIKEKPSTIPKRPPPPFHYYYLSELENQKEVNNIAAFKKSCKERWKQLSDEKKVVWINNAEIEYAKYEEALINYPQKQNSHKSILSKEEIQIRDRVAGKPSKPPGSAYHLFAARLLQSDEIKKSVPVKDRLNYISNQWKNCSEEEKKQYKDLTETLNEKYKLDYASYLETLPEVERKLELQKNLPKRRKSESLEIEKKEKITKKKSGKKPTAKKLVEPEQPPISAFKYFTTLYVGEEPVLQAWKALTTEQRKVYEDKLVEKKQAYIADFENFLKSLTKEELEAFSNSRSRIKKDEPEADDDEEGSGTTDESGTEDSEAESNDDSFD